MKGRRIACLLAGWLAVVCCLPPAAAEGRTMECRLEAAGTARPGDVVTVRLYADSFQGVEVIAMMPVLTLEYDAAVFSFMKLDSHIGDYQITEKTGQLTVHPISYSSNIREKDQVLAFNLAVREDAPSGDTTIGLTASSALDPANSPVNCRAQGTAVFIGEKLSDDDRLAGLVAEGAVLSPAFRSETTRYTAKVPYETGSIRLQATAADPGAVIRLSSGKETLDPNRPLALSQGDNLYRIQVVAPSGRTRDYTLTVVRASAPAGEGTDGPSGKAPASSRSPSRASSAAGTSTRNSGKTAVFGVSVPSLSEHWESDGEQAEAGETVIAASGGKDTAESFPLIVKAQNEEAGGGGRGRLFWLWLGLPFVLFCLGMALWVWRKGRRDDDKKQV